MRRELGQSNDIREKSIVFRLVRKNTKPALEGRHYPSQKRMPSEELIYDSETKKQRTIRYAMGESSIFKDEQPEKVVLGSIVFHHGSLIVPFTNPGLVEFLEKSNFNTGNPSRIGGSKQVFNHIDHEADAKGIMELEVTQITAANVVLQMKFQDLKAYARVLGVNINNGSEMIRHDMLVRAKKDPEVFMAGVDDPLVKRQQVILDAMELNIIEVSGRSVNWVFGDKKTLIMPVPIGQRSVAWFAEWTMNEKDGEEVFAEIERKVAKFSE